MHDQPISEVERSVREPGTSHGAGKGPRPRPVKLDAYRRGWARIFAPARPTQKGSK